MDTDVQVEGVSTAQTLVERIRSHLLAITNRTRLPLKWQSVKAVRSVRRFSGTETELLTKLCEVFSDDELLETNIAQRIDGELKVASWLTEKLFFSDASHQLGDADVFNASGALFHMEPHLYQLGRQRQSGNKKLIRVALTATDDDAHVLFALGIRALPAAGILKLSRPSKRRKCSRPERLTEAARHTLLHSSVGTSRTLACKHTRLSILS